jgi:hypothetical protein
MLGTEVQNIALYREAFSLKILLKIKTATTKGLNFWEILFWVQLFLVICFRPILKLMKDI